MKLSKKLGIGFIILGICCLLSAVGLTVYNRWEEEKAQTASANLLKDFRANISNSKQEELPSGSSSDANPPAYTLPESTPPQDIPPADDAEDITPPADGGGLPADGNDLSAEAPVAAPREMPTAQVDGYDCIGVLSIPALGLELPILTDWSYSKLKIAPCHYFGSYYDKDFVIAGHNYRAHFKRLGELQPGDTVLFTDISGNVYCYEVVLLETLPANATKEMITSGFDLSIYTCTPGRAARVIVRCNAIGQ